MINPFTPPPTLAVERGTFGDARRVRSGFLYRVIDLESPVCSRMVYSGWSLRQKITFDDQIVWFRISWLTIFRKAEFRLPVEIDRSQSKARLEINFSRLLTIRRFRIWIDGKIVYDEVN